MRAARQVLWSAFVFAALLAVASSPAQAQGKGKAKHYVVSSDKAVTVSRTVLIEQGYQIVRVERSGPTRVIYFRRGNNGRGKGKGPIQRMVIRTVRERVVFEEAEPSVLIDIDVRLKL
jgi:hypothetical protein